MQEYDFGIEEFFGRLHQDGNLRHDDFANKNEVNFFRISFQSPSQLLRDKSVFNKTEFACGF